MKIGDYSPPSLPSPGQQRDALQKGLGRAVQWALTRRLDHNPLLEACLEDQRFDWQVDGPRGDWLWRMVQAVDATDRFRVPILHALYDLSDDRNASQLCELARHYAQTGDEPFRTRLYEIVEQTPFPAIPWLGEKDIIALDGDKGFLFAARVRGQHLADREWDSIDGCFIDLATKRFGEEHVSGLLRASSDDGVNRFLQSWRRDKEGNVREQQLNSHRERMESIAATTAGEIIRAAESEDQGYWFICWGWHANQGDLQTVLQRIWSEPEPRVITKLLKVFTRRALPEFDTRLVDLCRHSDEVLRRRAFMALRHNAHPLIREFALTELQRGTCDGSVVNLLINNFQKGDEQQILKAMEELDNKCELHSLLYNLVKVLEKNPEADCSQLGVIIYYWTPCEKCRFHAVRLLLNQHVAPEWLMEECEYDSDEDSRKLLVKTTGATEAS